ncbi:MAG: type II secretion system protein [Patescibacteria group bacterium]|nr:type II secretion system protein [Patescibacteria group bacterium]
MKNNKGFTLIELLIVIGIIGFLAAAILVAVDPVKRIQEARDARRWSETNALLNAILNKQVDGRAKYTGVAGALIVQSASYAQVIVTDHSTHSCSTPATSVMCGALDAGLPAGYTLNKTGANTACVADLGDLAPTYIAQIPQDPGGASPATGYAIGVKNSGYYIIYGVDSGSNIGRITIGSCWAEQTATAPRGISVTR